MPLTHEMRKRLWWRAQKLSFAATKNPWLLKSMTRKQWAQIVYRILIRHPERPE